MPLLRKSDTQNTHSECYREWLPMKGEKWEWEMPMKG